jgi:hypothetical protein
VFTVRNQAELCHKLWESSYFAVWFAVGNQTVLCESFWQIFFLSLYVGLPFFSPTAMSQSPATYVIVLFQAAARLGTVSLPWSGEGPDSNLGPVRYSAQLASLPVSHIAS